MQIVNHFIILSSDVSISNRYLIDRIKILEKNKLIQEEYYEIKVAFKNI